MKTLQPHEVELVGSWMPGQNGVQVDDICKRIEWLVSVVLEEVGCSKRNGAWEIIYIDPSDQRYWVKFYPQSHMHGGGPPSLKTVSKTEAETDYVFQ